MTATIKIAVPLETAVARATALVWETWLAMTAIPAQSTHVRPMGGVNTPWPRAYVMMGMPVPWKTAASTAHAPQGTLYPAMTVILVVMKRAMEGTVSSHPTSTPVTMAIPAQPSIVALMGHVKGVTPSIAMMETFVRPIVATRERAVSRSPTAPPVTMAMCVLWPINARRAIVLVAGRSTVRTIIPVRITVVTRRVAARSLRTCFLATMVIPVRWMTRVERGLVRLDRPWTATITNPVQMIAVTPSRAV
jgi:hypothetical protein